MSKNRNIASLLGATGLKIEANFYDSSTVETLGGTDSAAVLALIDSAYISARAGGGGGGGGGVTSYTLLSDLPASDSANEGSLGYVEQNNKLYYSVGTGWFPVTPTNQAPTLNVSPEGIVSLSKNGAATTVKLTATDADSAAVLTFAFSKNTDFDGMATITQDSSVFTITPKSEANATTERGVVTFSVNDGASTVSNAVTFDLQYGIPITNYDSVSERNMGTAGMAYGYTFGLDTYFDRTNGIGILGNSYEYYTGSSGYWSSAFSMLKRNEHGVIGTVSSASFIDPKQEAGTALTGKTDLSGNPTYYGNNNSMLGTGGACGGGPGNYYLFIGGTNSNADQNAGGTLGYTLGPLVFEVSDSDIEFTAQTYNTGSGSHTSTCHYKGRLTDFFNSQIVGDGYANQVVCNDSATVIVWSNKYADNGSSSAGAVEFVTRDKSKKITESNAVTHRQTITSPVAAANNYFGQSLALSRDGLTLAVGEVYRRGTGSWSSQYMGGVSFYKRDSANDFTWSNIGNLEIDPGTWSGSKYNDGSTIVPYIDASNATGVNFGANVSISDDGQRAVAGAPYMHGYASGNAYSLGGAFVMDRSGDTWSISQVLVPQDCHGTAGFGGTQWNADYGNGAYNYPWYSGAAVGISPSGNTILVGSRGQIGSAGTYVDDIGNLVIYSKDSDNADFTTKNWRHGQGANVYGFSRHRNQGYNHPGEFNFSTETKFYASPHYNFNGVIEYDSA